MILVTGTKRSGTSMWMQVLRAAGLRVAGEPYMGAWEASIKDANPHGFFETQLRQGIFYATNPHPKTGRFLTPQQTEDLVVKVFIPGLIRTDVAYVGRVLATLRPWRQYVTSIERLYAMEDAWRASNPDKASPEAGDGGRRPDLRPRIHPAVEWWLENYDLVRDLVTRRYPFHLVTYDRVLRDPEAEVHKALAWLGRGDAAAAMAAVDPAVRTQDHADTPALPDGLTEEHVAVFDALYEAVDREAGLSPELVARLNTTQHALVEHFGALSRDRAREDADAAAAAAASDAD